MDIKELILRKLKEREISANEASRRIGRNAAYLNQFLKRGVPQTLPEHTRERLEELLGLNPGELRQNRHGTFRLPKAAVVRIHHPSQTDTIPILGAVEGGPDGFFMWNGDIVGYRSRPPELLGATQGFGLYVVGTSMSPRYREGEIVYVNPGKPVTADCYVVVQLRPMQEGEPPRALIKRYVRRTSTKLILHQYNPDKQIELPLDDVVSIQRIVGSGE